MTLKARSQKGVLFLVTGLLCVSGLLRMGSEAGQVLANAGVDPQQGVTADDQHCETPEDLAAVLTAIQSRESRLRTREGQLEDRIRAIQLSEVELQEKITELKLAESSLEEAIALASTAAEGDLSRLTAVYENMKPAEAAELFAEMDPEFAAGFLARMRTDVAASVLAGLEPDAAYAISVLVAGRNANVPTE